jgi:hypothetical protein
MKINERLDDRSCSPIATRLPFRPRVKSAGPSNRCTRCDERLRFQLDMSGAPGVLRAFEAPCRDW